MEVASVQLPGRKNRFAECPIEVLVGPLLDGLAVAVHHEATAREATAIR